ncbi:MAG: hypothetical protein ACR2NQ_02955 [Thermodesulfobacteriota bacterium]
MRRFFCFSRTVAVLAAAVLFSSCAAQLPFFNKKDELQQAESKIAGLVPLESTGLSTTKDIRADVVDMLMDGDDMETLKSNISSLDKGSEHSWTNTDTGNTFTVRAVEPMPSAQDGSRKIVVWGRKKGSSDTIVKTYRYHFVP